SRSPHRLSEISAGSHEIASSFALSYRYLMREQKQLFRQLALHPGADFSVYAAAAAGSISLDAAERALEALLDRYLLEERSPGRFSFHDLIHEYACRLSLLDDSEADRQRTVHRMLD